MERAAVWVTFLALSFSAVTGDIDCPAPRSPDNGQSFISNNGQIVTYRCNPGYRMRGSDRSMCVNNEWTTTPPECIDVNVYDPVETSTFDYSCLRTDGNNRGRLIPAPKLANSYIVRYDRLRHQNHPYDHYLAVQYNCNAGYVFEDRRFDRLYCRRGQWVGYLPRCVSRDVSFTSTSNRINNQVRSCTEGNGGCSHFCNSLGGSVKCSCQQGYRLGPDGTSCSDINECLDNNGNCQWKCWNTKGSFVCTCPPGYSLATDKRTCETSRRRNPDEQLQMVSQEVQDKCAVRNGGCGHICEVVEGNVQCICRKGYKLAGNGKSCLDLNECRKRNGGCQYYCFNTLGSHRCYCPPGLWLNEDGKSCSAQRPGSGSPVPEPPQGDSREDEKEESCFVRNGGCSHFCKMIRGVPQCSCYRGYQLSNDAKTCIDIDECQKNNGNCEGICNNRVGTFYCSCPQGYRIAADRRSCHDVDECLLNNGHGPCEDSCDNTAGSYRCSCRPGTKLSNNNHACEDIDECALDNFGCSHECRNAYGTAFCLCPTGYQLMDDYKTCVDFDECFIPEFAALCNGQCINTVGSFRCARPEGPDKEDTTPEPEGRSEVRVETTAISELHKPELPQCPPGYTPSHEGYCLDINECEEGILACSHRCVNTKGSAYCTCPRGYALQLDKTTCEDIDECAIERHTCHHTCINTPGSYLCRCLPGYILLANNTCEGCRKNSYRSDGDEMCIECPRDSHTTGNGKTSLSDCHCDTGYLGNPSEGEPCQDINECDTDNYGCSHTCVNSPGGVHCSCPDGYGLDHTGRICGDINECELNNGGCQQQCENADGSFKCSCTDGYTSSPTDPYACLDIDECLEDNGGCDHLCVNYAGGHYCACADGQRLSVDHKTCVEMTCHRIPVPPNSRVTCSSGDEDTEHFPVGTTCTVRCNKGYKLDGSAKLKCGADTEWKGDIPNCVAQSCGPLKKPENGDVHPASCYQTESFVDHKCYFTCGEGYRLIGKPVVTCRRQLTWDTSEVPTCVESVPLPFIQCPMDIFIELPYRESKAHVVIPDPKSNLDRSYISVSPAWLENMEGDFPAGTTKVTFTVTHPLKVKTDSCEMSVNIIDREPPIVINCPDSFIVEADSLEGAAVTWTEPTFTDNVEVVSISKSQEPGIVMNVGTHVVQYTGRDRAGNTAHCGFLVNVTQMECGPLQGLQNGEDNCMDWLFGVACHPTCNPGFVFYSSVSDFYMCDSTGVWQPSERIPDCSPFVPEPKGGCLPGTELRHKEDSDSWICVDCPRGMFWTAENATCAQCPLGTYQDEFGRTSCKPCVPDSARLGADVAAACDGEDSKDNAQELTLPVSV